MSEVNGSLNTDNTVETYQPSEGTIRNEENRQVNGTSMSSSTQTDTSSQSIDKETDKHDWCLHTLAIIVVASLIVLTGVLMIPGIKIVDDNKEIVFMVIGGLVTGFSMVLSYYFGSSAGSAQKTLDLANIAKSKQQESSTTVSTQVG